MYRYLRADVILELKCARANLCPGFLHFEYIEVHHALPKSVDKDGKKAVRPRAIYDAEKADKLTADILTPLVSICRAVLEDGHVADADLIDAAMIYGIGYPRHTGGPLHAHKTDRG